METSSEKRLQRNHAHKVAGGGRNVVGNLGACNRVVFRLKKKTRRDSLFKTLFRRNGRITCEQLCQTDGISKKQHTNICTCDCVFDMSSAMCEAFICKKRVVFEFLFICYCRSV